MQILMLSATFPYPPTRGGTQVRTFNLLQYLSQRHNLTLVTQRSADVTDTEIAELKQVVAELVVFPKPAPRSPNLAAKVQRFGQFLGEGTPPSVLASYVPEMQSWVDQAVQTQKFQALTCEHSVNEIYVHPEWQQRMQTVVNIHSSVYGACRNQLETGTSENTWRDRLNLPLLRRYEQRYCAKFSRIVVTTVEDQQQIQAFHPTSQIIVIPNGVDFDRFPYRATDPNGQQIIFCGAMDNLANIDAAKFLGLEILPLLHERYPDATVQLVGARPTPDVLALGDRRGITVTGQVPSMADYLHKATVCVVPMRTGFGIKNKTLEAMAAGAPVVGSDRGLEGLAIDGADIPIRALRADRAEDYVTQITRLLENPQLRRDISHNARTFVETEYTWGSAGQRYEQTLLSGELLGI